MELGAPSGELPHGLLYQKGGVYQASHSSSFLGAWKGESAAGSSGAAELSSTQASSAQAPLTAQLRGALSDGDIHSGDFECAQAHDHTDCNDGNKHNEDLKNNDTENTDSSNKGPGFKTNL